LRVKYVALFIFFTAAIFALGFYAYELSGSYIIVGFVATILSVIFGLLYAKAAILPIVRINEEIEALLKESLHELKIPIATVLNNAEMLKNTPMDEKNARRVERILISARRARDEQERLLELLKSSISEPIRSRFTLKEAISEVLEPFSDTRGVSFFVRVEEINIRCDKAGFVRAMTNIVENSIKFKKNDKANIEIGYEAPFLSIKDDGVGIPQGESLKIFDRFYKSARPKQGFGLGLFIVKSYCDKEGIKIYIDSNEGEGTTLSLDLSSTLSP